MSIIEPPSEPHYADSTIQLHHGDCLDVLRSLPDASVDAVVTDPPYGLANTDPAHVAETITRWVNGERDYLPGGAGFMGKAWDAFVPPVAVWDDCLRVLKPGGHVLAFAGSRTVDLMTLGLRLAGFDIRDSVAWLYGSGFPKSLNLVDEDGERTGWGTALKPAFEPIVVARKPLAGTVAANVLAHGTGALNIDGCRVGTLDDLTRPTGYNTWMLGGCSSVEELRDLAARDAWCPDERKGSARAVLAYYEEQVARLNGEAPNTPAGRWPANVILDESQAAALDEQSGEQRDGVAVNRNKDPQAEKPHEVYGGGWLNGDMPDRTFGGSGGASRFFYVAKADSSERVRVDGIAHPTVKPLDLMRWLVRLVTPPGGTVLEPFAGSGTTVEACILEGFRCVAIEREADYLPLIVQRINRRRDPVAAVKAQGEDGGLFDLLDGGAA